jgi:hypothetical protein
MMAEIAQVDTELRAKVHAIVWEETPTGGTWAWERLISRPGRDTEELEYVSRLWGYVFGVAYGIARGENAREMNEDCATRAYDVAFDLFSNEDEGLLDGLERVRAMEAGLSYGLGL